MAKTRLRVDRLGDRDALAELVRAGHVERRAMKHASLARIDRSLARVELLVLEHVRGAGEHCGGLALDELERGAAAGEAADCEPAKRVVLVLRDRLIGRQARTAFAPRRSRRET